MIPGLLVDYGADSQIIGIELADTRLRLREVKSRYHIEREQSQLTITLSKNERGNPSKSLLTGDDRIEIMLDADAYWSSICISDRLLK